MRVKLALIFIIAIGILLRVMSYSWNDRLQGDVNLFALTVREFIENDRLYYPMKYEYSENVDYLTLVSPASQHPPLVLVAVGLGGKLVGSDDAFSLLKIFAELSGLVLLGAVIWIGMRTFGNMEVVIGSGLVAISPMLVDFSANGSSYILVALLLLLAIVLLDRFQHDRLSHYALAGILSGVGLQTHGIMACLPAMFLVFWVVINRSQFSYRGLSTFALVMFLTLLPWMLWNLRHFDRPFYSYSSYYISDYLGWKRFEIVDGVIENRVERVINLETITDYLYSKTRLSAGWFLSEFVKEVSFFCVILMVVGGWHLFQHNRRRAIAWLLPILSYFVVVSAWPTFKYRFLVAILVPTYILAAIGFTHLYQRWRWVASILLIGTFLWAGHGLFEQPPTRYYRDDSGVETYQTMQALASTFGEQQEPDVTLGVSYHRGCLLETVYYHRFPFVCAADMIGKEAAVPLEMTEKLIHDFDVRYIWTDIETLPDIQTLVPSASVICQDEPFYVLEIGAMTTTEFPETGVCIEMPFNR